MYSFLKTEIPHLHIHYRDKSKNTCFMCDMGLPRFLLVKSGSICERCNKKYSEHPRDLENSYLNVLCDGSKVKLF